MTPILVWLVALLMVLVSMKNIKPQAAAAERYGKVDCILIFQYFDLRSLSERHSGIWKSICTSAIGRAKVVDKFPLKASLPSV
jgi:hypothetical protein